VWGLCGNGERFGGDLWGFGRGPDLLQSVPVKFRYEMYSQTDIGVFVLAWNSYLRTQLDRLQRCLRETDSHPPISYESTNSKPLLPTYSSRSTISTFTAATTRSTRGSAVKSLKVSARRPPLPPLRLRARQAREWVQRLRQLG
jgi:hypothetical protein